MTCLAVSIAASSIALTRASQSSAAAVSPRSRALAAVAA
jgi:hypothetical protein